MILYQLPTIQSDGIKSVIEFQYNDKKYSIIEYILFKLNFGQHLWKKNLTIEMELPKLENFLKKLQRSWEVSIKRVKEAIKKQFDKKRQNSQGLKQGDNVWLEAKNI